MQARARLILDWNVSVRSRMVKRISGGTVRSLEGAMVDCVNDSIVK